MQLLLYFGIRGGGRILRHNRWWATNCRYCGHGRNTLSEERWRWCGKWSVHNTLATHCWRWARRSFRWNRCLTELIFRKTPARCTKLYMCIKSAKIIIKKYTYDCVKDIEALRCSVKFGIRRLLASPLSTVFWCLIPKLRWMRSDTSVLSEDVLEK